MNTATNKLDCICPNCRANHDVSLQHDGKYVKCIGCDQPFKITFSIPAAQRKLMPPPYRPASTPVHTSHLHVQANTQPVIIASFFALVLAVAVIGFAIAGSSGEAEPQNSADLVESKTQELAIDGSQKRKAKGQRTDRVLARLRKANLKADTISRRDNNLRAAKISSR